MRSSQFEAVECIDEYYDGPRSGVALVGGSRYRFKSRLLDAIEYRGDFESVDLFEIRSLERSDAPVLLAKAEFRARGDHDVMPDQARSLEARWEIIGECDGQQRVAADRIHCGPRLAAARPPAAAGSTSR